MKESADSKKKQTVTLSIDERTLEQLAKLDAHFSNIQQWEETMIKLSQFMQMMSTWGIPNPVVELKEWMEDVEYRLVKIEEMLKQLQIQPFAIKEIDCSESSQRRESDEGKE